MPLILSHIFRAYDIRGKAETEVSEELCDLVGKAFGMELRERYKKEHPEVIVGRDARTHSPLLEGALIKGLTSVGCHVKKIGMVPSPVNYFALCHFECDGSVQITASHNQKEDNGLKLQLRGAEAFAGEELQNLREKIEEGKFKEGKGSVEEVNAVTPYKERVKDLVRHAEPLDRAQDKLRESAAADDGINLKIAVDFGNGVAGPVYGSILKELGAELIELFQEPDGTFPNHIADPSKHETLKDLIATVKKEKADLGLAFDGDGDRVGVVDEKGNVVSPDYLLLLLAEDHLKRNPGASIIYTVSMSSILETEVMLMGGKPHMCIVGHSFVEHAMREFGSHLGAEQSGHFFCGENYFDFDDALVAAIRILSIVGLGSGLGWGSSEPEPKPEPQPLFPFSLLIERYPRIFQSPEWRPHCDDDKKSEVIRAITEYFQKEGYPCITIDGVRIDFGEGAWAGIRQSNTSPKISVCMEARSPGKLKEIEKIVQDHLATYPSIRG